MYLSIFFLIYDDLLMMLYYCIFKDNDFMDYISRFTFEALSFFFVSNTRLVLSCN